MWEKLEKQKNLVKVEKAGNLEKNRKIGKSTKK